LPPKGILPAAKFTLFPSLALSYIGSVTARHSSSGRQPNFAAWYKEWNYGLYRQSEKLVKRQYLLHMPDNMVNFGPLAAEIGIPVWGTPANFNGFRLWAALLHDTVVVGVSQILRVEQRVPPIFGMAAITLGIGPHSSFVYF